MTLSLSGVTAGYGSTVVLRGLDLEISPGERRAIVGRNGAGKTTLLRTIMGFVHVKSGEMSYGEDALNRMKPRHRAKLGIGYVPQGRQIFKKLTVVDNLRLAGLNAPPARRAELLESMFDEFPMLREKRKQMGGGLSGGQQQVLAIARALMVEPKLLLLDEPTEGVQPSIRQQISEQVNRIADRTGMTVVVVEQNLDFAASVADQCSIIFRGQVVQNLETNMLLEDRHLQHQYLGV